MHYVDAGQGWPAFFFVHGFGCSHADWSAQCAALQNDRQVIACDLRAHGATPGRPHECSIEHYGGDVAALLANLEIPRAVLVGHSMGCRVVLEAARLEPKRVAGVVLLDGSRLGSGDPVQAEAALRARIESTGYAHFARVFFSQMFLEPSARSQAVVERAMRLPDSIGTALLPRVARWDAEHADDALGALRAPLMLIQTTRMEANQRVAMRAGESSPWLDWVKARIPAARIEVLSGLGHFAQLEAPELINTLLRSFALSLP